MQCEYTMHFVRTAPHSPHVLYKYVQEFPQIIPIITHNRNHNHVTLKRNLHEYHTTLNFQHHYSAQNRNHVNFR